MLWRLLVRMLRELGRAGHRLAGFLEGVGSALEERWSEDKIPRTLRERFPNAPDHWLEDIANHVNLDELQDVGPKPVAEAAQPLSPLSPLSLQALQPSRRSNLAIARPNSSARANAPTSAKSQPAAKRDPIRAPRPSIVVESERRSTASHVAARQSAEERCPENSLHLGEGIRRTNEPASTFSAVRPVREAPANHAQTNSPNVASNPIRNAAQPVKQPENIWSFAQGAEPGMQRMGVRAILRRVLTAFTARDTTGKEEEMAFAAGADAAPLPRPMLWADRRHTAGRTVTFRSHASSRAPAAMNERRMLDPDDRWPALPPHDEGLVSAPIERTRLDRLRAEQEQGSWSA